MSGTSFKGDKLVGRSNYIEWLTNATLFFEINGYMSYIDGSESEPNKSLYYKDNKEAYSPELAVRYIERLSEYQRNNTRALGAIKSVISLDNTERFKDKKSAKDLFDAIQSTFGESSLELIGRYLDRILEADYTSFKTIDEYTSQIQSSAIYLKELKYEVPRPFLAWLLFKGLPTSFDSFNSRKYEELAKDLTKVDISKLIADLISEEARMNASQSLEANRATRANRDSFCSYCKQKGHLEARCFKKYPELKPKEFSSSSKPKKDSKEDPDSDNDNTKESKSTKVIMSILANNQIIQEKKLVLDSGATEHYTPNKDWLLDYKDVSNKSIILANGNKIAIEGIGNIPILIEGKDALITKVNYIPSIKTTLISTRELAKKGWETTCKGNKAIISYNKAKLKVVANWVSNIYYLDININYNRLDLISTNTTTYSSNKALISQQDNNLKQTSLNRQTDKFGPKYYMTTKSIYTKGNSDSPKPIKNKSLYIDYSDSFNKGDSNKLNYSTTLEDRSNKLDLDRYILPKTLLVSTLLDFKAKRGINSTISTKNSKLSTIFKEPKGYIKLSQAKFPIYTDNKGALALAENPVFHERTKHIAVKYHYIRQLIEEGTIDLVYINTKDQKSDGLTKPLDKTKFKEFLIQLGLYIKL